MDCELFTSFKNNVACVFSKIVIQKYGKLQKLIFYCKKNNKAAGDIKLKKVLRMTSVKFIVRESTVQGFIFFSCIQLIMK